MNISEENTSLIANKSRAVLMSTMIRFPFKSFLGVKTPEQIILFVFPIGLKVSSGYFGFTENISKIPEGLYRIKSNYTIKGRSFKIFT